MGVKTRLRANVRAARLLYGRLRERHSQLHTICWQLLQAVALRGYRKLAYGFNDGVLQRWVTPLRFRRFQSRIADQLGGHFYVIVMPQTLHFLLPCLSLVVKDVRLILLLNGAAQWEADLLKARWPHLPQFRVATLPHSSVNHGAMVNLLLENNEQDFGLLDHDLYLFDTSALAQLQFAEKEFLICLWAETDPKSQWIYPLTHFLYFRVGALRRLMKQYGVGADLYRHVPEPARSRLLELGLREGHPLKSYHNFFDTLHVLIALAYAEGLELCQLEVAEGGVYHVGGTSIGTYHTKDMFALYSHLRFLELSGDPQLRRRYAILAAPFSDSSELRGRVLEYPEFERGLEVLDNIIERLQLERETQLFGDAHAPEPDQPVAAFSVGKAED